MWRRPINPELLFKRRGRTICWDGHNIHILGTPLSLIIFPRVFWHWLKGKCLVDCVLEAKWKRKGRGLCFNIQLNIWSIPTPPPILGTLSKFPQLWVEFLSLLSPGQRFCVTSPEMNFQPSAWMDNGQRGKFYNLTISQTFAPHSLLQHEPSTHSHIRSHFATSSTGMEPTGLSLLPALESAVSCVPSQFSWLLAWDLLLQSVCSQPSAFNLPSWLLFSPFTMSRVFEYLKYALSLVKRCKLPVVS